MNERAGERELQNGDEREEENAGSAPERRKKKGIKKAERTKKGKRLEACDARGYKGGGGSRVRGGNLPNLGRGIERMNSKEKNEGTSPAKALLGN